MDALFRSTPFILLLIFSSYWLGIFVYTRSRMALLHPIIISISTIIGVLLWLDIPYETFVTGSSFINFLLGPSVVALGYTLYEQINLLKGKVTAILIAVIVGSFIGIVSVVFLCKLMEVSPAITASLQPKSVTTPIALSLSVRSGGIPALTAIIVVICGILGGIIGPWIFKICRIRSRIAQGLALGSAAHGLGTARAIEIGAIEGAISGLAIGLMGVMTSLLIPILEYIISLWP